jgi:O-antigen/teichoic acid export membrane protein
MLESLRGRVARRLPKGRSFRRFTMLSGALLLGQSVILLSSPVLTRLYTPAEFGVYAVFTALAGILGNVLSLRYEAAVPLARDDQDAASLMALAVMLTAAFSLLCVPVIWLGGSWLAWLTGMADLARLLWLLPLTVIALGTAQVLSYWSVYRGTFRLNALSRLSQSVAQAGLQIGLGAFGLGASGMVLGYGLAYVVWVAHFAVALPPEDRALLRTPDLAAAARLGRVHWHYPLYSTPATMLEAGTQLLPAVFLAVIYGPAVAGWFSLGQRLMGLPVRLVARAASQVFLSEAAQRDRAGVYRLFKRASLRFLALGVLGMAPLLAAGPTLFAWLFGEPWRPAGEIVQALVPLYLTRFVVTPVSQTLNIVGRQDLHLVSSSVDALSLVGCFGLAWWLHLPPVTSVLLYSLEQTAGWLGRAVVSSSPEEEPCRDPIQATCGVARWQRC